MRDTLIDITGVGGFLSLGSGLAMYDYRLALIGFGVSALILSVIGVLRWRA